VRILAGSCHPVKLARIVIAKCRIDAVFFFLRPLSSESRGERLGEAWRESEAHPRRVAYGGIGQANFGPKTLQCEKLHRRITEK